ncbi:MAG: hypothetical protein K2X38_17330, partial [Gemmataceae bacterium]|nr:hypothetical protein [Gemmataceae bacterium]
MSAQAGNRAWFLKRDYGLYSNNSTFLYNAYGANEDWLQGYSHPGSSGGASNNWYFILPTGGFYAWSGNGTATGVLLAKLDVIFWQAPSEATTSSLYSDDDIVNFLKNRQGFDYAAAGYNQNYGGQQEKWIRGSFGYWYFIKPDGSLYRWDGTANAASGYYFANLPTTYYDDPSLLLNPLAGATASLSGNQLVVDGSSNSATSYVGEWWVEAKNVNGTTSTKTLYRFGFSDANGLGLNWAQEKVSTTSYSYDFAGQLSNVQQKKA